MDKRKKVSFVLIFGFLFVCLCGKIFQRRFLPFIDERINLINKHDIKISSNSMQKGADYTLSSIDTIEDVVMKAKEMNTSPLMVTFVNDAYLSLVYNWLCNTIGMNVHNQILMITTSQFTKEEIQTKYKNVTICVIPVDTSLQGDQIYSQVGYVELMIIRTRIITALLKADIEIFQFECDFLWIKNPIEMLRGYKGRYDALFLKNYESDADVNGGFLYLFPTNRTQSLFLEIRRLMNLLETHIKHLPKNQKVPDEDNDQYYLSRLLNKQFAGVKALVLPYSDFADGRWYTFDAAKRKSIKPYMIHNDYIAGNQAKVNRVKQFGHWFLSEDNKCKIDIFKSVAESFI